MFSCSDVARACGVGQPTIRGWQSRAPGVSLGSRNGKMKHFTLDEGLAFLITGEIIRRGLALPSIAIPCALRMSREHRGKSVWLRAAPTGELIVSTDQPDEPALHLPLATLADRLTRVAGERRIERQTR